jgi:hypothetical protein
MMNLTGENFWIFIDGFIPDHSKDDIISKKPMLCVLNMCDESAHISIIVYYSDEEPVEKFYAECGARRVLHADLEKLRDADGGEISRNKPFALKIISDQPIIAAHTRIGG